VELKQAMLERAHSVDLDPEIEALCINDLAHRCSHDMRKNEVSTFIVVQLIQFSGSRLVCFGPHTAHCDF